MLTRRLTRAVLLAGLMVGATQSASAAVLNIGNSAEPSTLDPQKTNGIWETRIARALFERLVTYDREGNLIPGLAESWDISADGKTYSFHLRQAEWSDGTPLTADDAVFALRRLLLPATLSHNANLYYAIENAQAMNTGQADPSELGVSAPDERTLVIRLEQPTAYFLQALAMAEAAPLPRHVIEAEGNGWTHPGTMVSSGAFTLSEWSPQAHVEVVRNEHFYAADRVELDGVRFYPTDDMTAALNRFRTGALDIAYSSVSPSRFEWLQQNMPDSVQVSPWVGEYFYMFNLRDGQPLADKRVREALSLVVRREVIIEQIMNMGQTASYWYVPRGADGGTQGRLGFADMPMAERQERARKLLAEAGFGPDNPLELTLSYNTLDDHKKIAVAIAAMWKPLGVEVELTNAEAAVHFANIKEGQFEVARYGMIATVNDPYDFLNAYAQGGSAQRATGYHNADYDALVADSTRELDPERRAELLTQAEQMLLDDHALLPIYDYVTAHLVAPRVAGWQPNALDVHPLRYVTLED